MRRTPAVAALLLVAFVAGCGGAAAPNSSTKPTTTAGQPAGSAAGSPAGRSSEVRSVTGVVDDPAVKAVGAWLRFDEATGAVWGFFEAENVSPDSLLASATLQTVVLVAGSTATVTLRDVGSADVSLAPTLVGPGGSIWIAVRLAGVTHEQFAAATGIGFGPNKPFDHGSSLSIIPDPMQGVEGLTASRLDAGAVEVSMMWTGKIGSYPFASWDALVLDPEGVPLGIVELTVAGTGEYTRRPVEGEAALPAGDIGSVKLISSVGGSG